jgi:ABC-type arginine transport system ATPase subunit
VAQIAKKTLNHVTVHEWAERVTHHLSTIDQQRHVCVSVSALAVLVMEHVHVLETIKGTSMHPVFNSTQQHRAQIQRTLTSHQLQRYDTWYPTHQEPGKHGKGHGK